MDARPDEAAVETSEPGAAIDGLRDTWSRYVSDWKDDPALNLGYGVLGEEWGGGGAFADEVVAQLAAPYLGDSVDVLELGCGGGKYSLRLAPRCRSLTCTDISAQMIEQTRATLAAQGLDEGVAFRQLNGVDFEGIPSNSVDFVFSYDVQLHLQPQNVFSYLLDARRILRAGGIFMLHQIDLTTAVGMGHFIMQFQHGTWKCDLGDPRRRGHIFFMSEDQLRAIAAAAGFSVERIVKDFPREDEAERRDLVAFLDGSTGNRLRDVPVDTVRLVQLEDQNTVYAVWDGHRAAIGSADYFVEAGFDWDRVDRVDAGEMSRLEEVAPLGEWEWPRRAAGDASG
jgi:SAM-dependent methyltransferase